MPVNEFIVQNVSDVNNPPGRVYDVAGVDIFPGESRNLLDLGATLEQIARDENLTAGLIAGDLIGPPQTWYVDETTPEGTLVPGGVYLYAPDAAAGRSFTLPDAKIGAQVPLAVEVINPSAHTLTLELSGDDESIPAGPLALASGESGRLFTYFDGSAWGWTLIRNT